MITSNLYPDVVCENNTYTSSFDCATSHPIVQAHRISRGRPMLVIGEGRVHTIGNSAFRGCTSLKRVVLGKEVKKICNAAFMDCNNLTQIVYKGSKTEWEQIVMEDDAVPYTIRVIFLA